MPTWNTKSKRRETRRKLFLERLDGLIPRQSLADRIPPVFPEAHRGFQPYPLPVMLRVHSVQLFRYAKVRYCGLAKNKERLAPLFGLGNLLAVERQPRG